MEKHSLTHFLGQPWCKMSVESRRRDSPHRAFFIQKLQFDYGYMGDRGPLQIDCFLVRADTSSGAIHATIVPDSKKMNMRHVVAATGQWVRHLEYERFCLRGDKE